MSDTENGTNCLQSWQKKLSTSQQVTQHTKINQDEQEGHFFQIYRCKISFFSTSPKQMIGFHMLRNG